jgi:D-methionine transport system substrate-binding protein
MKKKLFASVLALALIASLAACSGGSAATASPSAAATPAPTPTAETVTLKVGASPTPHAQILEQVVPILAEQGIKLEIVEYTDYVIPNTAVEEGENDANYFQHQPYLDTFNADNGTHLVSVAAIHYEPFGVYAGKTKSLDKLADGAAIAIPNDGSNEARALYLLEAQGLITLNHEVEFAKTTPLDIKTNPKNLKFEELEAAMLPNSLEDVDLAVINGNYAIGAGLSIADALATEDPDSEAAQTYANIVVVKEGNENNPAIQALVKALQSDTVRDYINKTFNGAVVPLF